MLDLVWTNSEKLQLMKEIKLHNLDKITRNIHIDNIKILLCVKTTIKILKLACKVHLGKLSIDT